jgi:hypothetical protein
MEFMLMWGLVAVCARNCPKFACLGKDFSLLKSLVRGICQLFKYASDFIWMLGKNNLDSLVSAGCFRYRQARIVAITYCRQRKPSNFGAKKGSFLLAV